MDNVLAVTADLHRCSVALQFNGQIYEQNANVNAPTYLVKITEELCEQNNIDINQLNRVVTVSGPGSFTGIRTAQSFAKGLGVALNIPVGCVSYFQVIKQMFGNNCITIIKSEKNQVYYMDFTTGDYGVVPYDQFDQTIKSNVPLVGDKIEQLQINMKSREFIEITDYKVARNFLSITDVQSVVTPLYINVSNTSTSF